jgi:hypothetical protein
VPVFRTDDGTELPHPWLLSFITCAAPYAPEIGQPQAGDLLQKRIHRVLAIARALGHTQLVLGAWGCGAFGNDPYRTATDFRQALEGEFDGAFSEIVFAITDWSPARKFLGPSGMCLSPRTGRESSRGRMADAHSGGRGRSDVPRKKGTLTPCLDGEVTPELFEGGDARCPPRRRPALETGGST